MVGKWGGEPICVRYASAGSLDSKVTVWNMPYVSSFLQRTVRCYWSLVEVYPTGRAAKVE